MVLIREKNQTHLSESPQLLITPHSSWRLETSELGSGTPARWLVISYPFIIYLDYFWWVSVRLSHVSQPWLSAPFPEAEICEKCPLSGPPESSLRES